MILLQEKETSIFSGYFIFSFHQKADCTISSDPQIPLLKILLNVEKLKKNNIKLSTNNREILKC